MTFSQNKIFGVIYSTKQPMLGIPGCLFTLLLVEIFSFLNKCFQFCVLRSILCYTINLAWVSCVVPLMQYLTTSYFTSQQKLLFSLGQKVPLSTFHLWFIEVQANTNSWKK